MDQPRRFSHRPPRPGSSGRPRPHQRPIGGGGPPGGPRQRTRPGEVAVMLLGEPSPSLEKINRMTAIQLQAKIVSLETEQARLNTRIDRLRKQEPVPADKIKTITDLITRLEALKKIASDRLSLQMTRKTAFDNRGNK